MIIEKDNLDSINLFKEGLFWRCYEYSAWRFSVNIKDYRVLKKHIKVVKQDIVYLGFPESILETVISLTKDKGSFFTGGEKHISIQSFLGKEGFEQWKSNIPIVAVDKETDKPFELIIEKIKNYPVANRTPIETLEFLAKIQKEINGII